MQKESFGSILKSLREKKGLTQAELAQHLGTTQQSIGRYERNDREAGYEFLIKTSDFFTVSIDYLLGHKTQNDNEVYKIQKTLEVVSPDNIVSFIEKNHDNIYKNKIYNLVTKNLTHSLVDDALTVDLLYITNTIYDYIYELCTSFDLNSLEEYKSFIMFYAKFRNELDKICHALLDEAFLDINRNDYYFKDNFILKS